MLLRRSLGGEVIAEIEEELSPNWPYGPGVVRVYAQGRPRMVARVKRCPEGGMVPSNVEEQKAGVDAYLHAAGWLLLEARADGRVD